MSQLILLRHGQSDWNAQGLFTGWVDVELSPTGLEEATAAGTLLSEANLAPDVVHTSLLARAIATANVALQECGRHWIDVRRSWRLNERHYGALQGKSKAAVREESGEEQYMRWRRSYDIAPPPLGPGPHWYTSDDDATRYAELGVAVPPSESLKDVVARLLPYWEQAIVPDLQAGRSVLIVAHGNSLRALIKHLDQISDTAIAELNIPTGIPLYYELDATLTPITKGGEWVSLEDPSAAMAAVANEGH